MTAAIDVREAFRIHRLGGATSVALQGLTLQVDEGEIVVVLGPSGSGKTTLLRTVAGFDTLSAGVARVLGVDVGSLGSGAAARFRAENLGLLDQHYARALSPDLTCVHTVGLGLELLGRPRREARAAAAALLERVGLGDRLDARPGALSGGEQQRVALCAALAHRPRLLLADEPAGELDAENARLVYGLIQELAREQGTTALVVSHDEEAATIADRLVYVRDGRVVEEGRPGGRHSLVVTAPGWVRIPDPLLEALGSPTRLHAEGGDDGLVLSRDAADRDLETPAPAMFHERAAQPGEVVAELRGVSKRFERAVLDGVSAEFRAGTLTAVVGRSGSGKTTLLHLLAGLDQPSGGQVVVAGREIEALDRAARRRGTPRAGRADHPGAGPRAPPVRARERRARPDGARARRRPGRGADRGRPRRPPRPPGRPPLGRRAPARRDRARARRRAEAPARRRADRPPRPVERARRRGAPPPPRPRARHGRGVRDPRRGRDRAGGFDDR